MNFINAVSGAVFGTPAVIMLALTGLFFTVKTHGFQLFKAPLIFKTTFLSLFKKSSRESSDGRISKLQSLSTSLSATIGTGSVVGVAAAIAVGGRGAVFWMWAAALLGMMTAYAEGVLSVKYRGGAFVYIKRGLKSPAAAKIYAILSVGAALGMGNMAQTSCISGAALQTFDIPKGVTAAVITLTVGIFAMGGLKRTAGAAEKLLPLSAVLYIAGCFAVIILFRKNLAQAFSDVFTQAFGLRAAAGGAFGRAVSEGFRRGVFSNEAGLGTTAAVHSDSQTDIPCEQGMWNIFEVFVDTILLCTLTAAVIMSSGADLASPMQTAEQTVAGAFGAGLGKWGEGFAALSVMIFAFFTVLGQTVIGEKAFRYAFPKCPRGIFCAVFTAVSCLGCITASKLCFEISDIFNGLLIIPNLAALLILSGEVKSETDCFLK